MRVEYNLIQLILFFPMIGFLVNFLFSRFIKKNISSIIASISIFLSFLFSFIAFEKLRTVNELILYSNIFMWIITPEIQISFTLIFDRLSSIMTLVVSFVSFLIHVYSIEYMSDDKDYKRFFSYLNLFVFFMLILVLADNIVMMFVGWEGVGLCSYLLIGFWYEDVNNSKAAKKAFIVNRIGDAFFIIAILLIYNVLSSNNIYNLSFDTINSNTNLFKTSILWQKSVIDIITLFLFIGACGKSAQFPLHIWLPDAMAGPTPVSALIHAATMVTAGIYMIARLNPLYQNAPDILDIIMIIAAMTSLFAALIATSQRDIKKILAYSTISQLGYMFLGVCSINWVGGMFHLTTHAFFKALLFLGAGAVIHALGGEQDIYKMFNLSKNLKKIMIYFAVGWLSISGFPYLSGYFSKDFIIENLFIEGKKTIWALSLITAFLTAFYMTRLFSIAFLKNSKTEIHIHKPTKITTIPLFILSILSISSGFMIHQFTTYLGVEIHKHYVPYYVKYLPLFSSFFGIFLGFYLTKNKDKISDFFFFKFFENKFYIDEIYNLLIVKPLQSFAKVIFQMIDRKLIDNFFVEGSAKITKDSGKVISLISNGQVQLYALFILFGILIIIFSFRGF